MEHAVCYTDFINTEKMKWQIKEKLSGLSWLQVKHKQQDSESTWRTELLFQWNLSIYKTFKKKRRKYQCVISGKLPLNGMFLRSF